MRNAKPSLLCAGAALLCGTVVGAAEPAVRIREPWRTVFGGDKTTFHLQIRDPDQSATRLTWRLAVHDRTVARRDEIELRGGEGDMPVILPLPPVKTGVVMPADLHVILAGPDNRQVAEARIRLWVFPTAPWEPGSAALKALDIHLFDPEGRTERVLTDTEAPFRAVRNPDALPELASGVLVVGEGVSFLDYRGLWRTLVRVAAKGIPVLCLAPRAGECPLPGTATTELPAPSEVRLRGTHVIRELDKRLDTKNWPGSIPFVRSSFTVEARYEQVVGCVKEEGGNWPWLEVRFGPGAGALIVSGFAVVDKWEDGPTPRFLLARMLEILGDVRKKREGGRQ